MKEKRDKELLDKISKALRRRHQFGLPTKPPVRKPIKPLKEVMGKLTRPAKANTNIISNDAIFLSGSIGDVIALESFFTETERSQISKIYYATQKAGQIQELLSSLSSISALSIKDHVSVWNDFSNMWAFYNKQECISKFNSKKNEIPPGLITARDFSIEAKFDQINRGAIRYNGSSFLKHQLCDITYLNLPKSYIVVCPHSTDKRLKNRDFDNQDWDQCLKYLKSINHKGIVLGGDAKHIPKTPWLIQIETSITEAVEVLKLSNGYIGIDSCLSVLAAKLFEHPYLLVKSVNPFCYKYAKCYYAPKKEFDFMSKHIVAPVVSSLPKKLLDHPTRSMTLRVCQGIGDIFWVYQKFAPYVDEINFSISTLTSKSDKLSHRAVDFLHLLPKVRNVDLRFVSHEDYNKHISTYFPMTTIMEKFNNGLSVFEYACNRELEKGVRIEQIDSDYPIEENVSILAKPCVLDFEPNKYLIAYISGTTMDREIAKRLNIWTVEMWVEFVRLFSNRYDLKLPVLVIGSSYDDKAASPLFSQLKEAGFEVRKKIDAPAENVTYMIKNCTAFLGYQSGLSVLADNMDVKQVMMYFPYLRNMLYTWSKNRNINDGIFNADTFDRKPRDVIAGLRMSM